MSSNCLSTGPTVQYMCMQSYKVQEYGLGLGSLEPYSMQAAMEAATATRVQVSKERLVRVRTSCSDGCKYCTVLHNKRRSRGGGGEKYEYSV